MREKVMKFLDTHSGAALLLGIVAAVAVAVTVCMALFGTKESDMLKWTKRAQDSETAACKKAGYVESYWNWQGGLPVFNCQDEKGRFFPIALPPCNTHGGQVQGAYYYYTDECKSADLSTKIASH